MSYVFAGLSRHELLYLDARVHSERMAQRRRKHAEDLIAMELRECSFRPQTCFRRFDSSSGARQLSPHQLETFQDHSSAWLASKEQRLWQARTQQVRA